MAETPLPSRKSLKRQGVTLDDASPILRDYVRRELMTLEEWIATYDKTAAEGYHETVGDVFDSMRVVTDG